MELQNLTSVNNFEVMNRIESHFEQALETLKTFAADKDQMQNIQKAADADRKSVV